ncbi:hypothetical protein B0G80_7751 [Paraburkholderia sp. BL6669N2]|uniref:hypothetical protein n=1 Tax=unclassified Paraburkholderia TaxID=2615204 RepID=UPI000E26F935|nr:MULTISPECIES: hypothetical protein [unclassified Paraburkholderia]REG51259.1 hypothetical protein B0G80_7751 [Paraburkholderia sp. BL6669N2]TDY20334.1 hypothetical protein B0G81_0492 [Paraburkholderia sp. BL6665CI2N2]
MKNRQCRRSHMLRSVLLASALASPVFCAQAQDSPSASAPQAVGAAALVEATARVVRIDTQNDAVTLRGPRGNANVVKVDPAVGDVSKLKVGDEVHIAYEGALLLSADKVDTKGIRTRVEDQATNPASGGISVQMRRAEIIATVQKIDRKKRQVTLRGPSRTVTLQASPEVQLEKLKVGDSIRAHYASAKAVQITRNGQAVQ